MTIPPASDVKGAHSTFAVPTLFADLALGSEIRLNPDNLPPHVRAAVESDSISDLQPSEIEQILRWLVIRCSLCVCSANRKVPQRGPPDRRG